ncbi:coatomer beta subunit [Moniliophthora roreri MCA 2997]|uniref:Coatomer beta subunit n=1 Tax=Moniliophthora roreri (strain MCA 2997) TaxID=1381753 RepID=V2XVW8_MONRO|nr:coatomer beta subunit [Moniliophthora roreri MCA 2997]
MDETSEQEAVPWYRDYSSSNPFRLYRKFCIPDKDPRNPHSDRFRTLAAFPWTRESHKSLWNDRKLEINTENWNRMVDEYSDAILVGSDRRIYVLWLHSARRPLSIELPPQPKSNDRIVPTDKTHVSWALSPDVLYQPFIIFSNRYLLYIYSFQTKTVDTLLRGHGGHITSIALHPSLPHLFATTSRDFSVRIYDLTQKPRERAENPIWPPRDTPSLAGPAHGLDLNDKEGIGIGRCVLVLMGGRSGGHMGDVFAASFHRHYPIIATCGMDRTVKIWHIPTITPGGNMMREDKPLFSASCIHTARVLSIDWLSDDLLLSHSAPPFLATSNDSIEDEGHDQDEEKPTEYTVGAGQMVLWRWLGLDRFFPPGWNEYETRQEVLRGCASDYEESGKQRILAENSM